MEDGVAAPGLVSKGVPACYFASSCCLPWQHGRVGSYCVMRCAVCCPPTQHLTCAPLLLLLLLLLSCRVQARLLLQLSTGCHQGAQEMSKMPQGGAAEADPQDLLELTAAISSGHHAAVGRDVYGNHREWSART